MTTSTSTAPERGYRLLFAEACDGLFISTEEGVYLDVNPSGHRMLGYDPGELIGTHIAKVTVEHDVPRRRATLASAVRGHAQTELWSMVRKDGSIAPLEVFAQGLSDGTVLAVVRDVAAHASEAKLRSILNTAPDTIMAVDRDGRISFVNRTVAPYTPAEVVGTSCYDYVPPEMRARVEQAIDYVFATGLLDTYEIENPPHALEQTLWSVRAGPQIEADRVVAVTLCATDVTEQRRVMARSNELLQRLRKIASLVPGVVYQYQLRADGSSSFPYASERMREVFHVGPEDAREDAMAAFANVHPSDYSGVIDSLRRSARTETAWRHEFRVVSPDGETRWLFGNSTPENQPDGSTLFHGFITDVTLQKLAAQSRAKLEEQLRQAQKMESIGQLAGGVAHDFNNALMAIGAYAELAQDRTSPEAPIWEHLAEIRAAAARAAVLTQQLLAFARKKIVQPQETDLNAMVNRIAPMVRRLVAEHIRVELKLATELCSVTVDVGSIEQVVMNLIVNARDAMPDGGVLTLATAEVIVDAGAQLELAPGRYAMLSVSDTGTGMEPEVRARLFEPFFTTKPQGSGTGLGLAMCHGIVKQAGGSIAVESELGVGSSLSVWLPSGSHAHPQTAVTSRPSAASMGHETVLVVEDEPAILRVTEATLQKLGYRVLCASDGVEALDLVKRSAVPIDLLLTDVVMPRLGGRELATRVRELRPGIKVLYTSGYAHSILSNQGELRDEMQLMEKPYTFAALAERIRALLDPK